MSGTVTWVGFDVHARSAHAAALDVATGELQRMRFGAGVDGPVGWLRELPRTLRAFLDLCGRADTAHCAFSAGSPARTRAKFAALLSRLRKHPPPGVSYAELVATTVLGGLYESTAGWSAIAKTLQNVWAGGASPGSPRASAAPARSRRYSGQEQLVAIVCADSPNPPPGAFAALDAFASRRSGVMGPPVVWNSEPCATWPAAVAADRYAGPWNRRTASPVLVIGNTYDPGTPYQGSAAMAHELARARLLTVDGYGHGPPSPCKLRFTTRYLLDAAAQRRQVQTGPAAVQRITITSQTNLAS